MLSVRYGGKTGRAVQLIESPAHLVVRTTNRAPLAFGRAFGAAGVSARGREALEHFERILQFPDFGVEVYRTDAPRPRARRDTARAVLKRDPAVEFAGRVLLDRRSGRPVLYTENLFVKFDDDLAASRCRAVLKRAGLSVKREIEYARNAWFVAAPAGTGQKVFAAAEKLLRDPAVELCHPELVRPRRARAVFPQQWHLAPARIGGVLVNQHANVAAAWEVGRGEGVVIAVIDDGVDPDHEEFRSSGKIVAPRDATRGSNDPRPKTPRDMHGHACAGVACADGRVGASGVAPAARLMPIRLASQLGSQSEADAFAWAADRGADVISCSWGPEDGDFESPADPVHRQVTPLPDSTRLAIDYAVRTGRGGRGCVVLFAAGNGNESVDNDGYASYPKVIAVAASDDRGKKAPYSDFGRAVWCAFPSNHYYPSVTPGIWTTDRPGGGGYNPGDERSGDAAGNYTNDFGGTSSACPGAAGVAALVISRNPELRWDEVRNVLKRSCDRIDPSGGGWDASGRSPFYGWGRLNARRAVDLALPAQPAPLVIRTAVQDVPVPDLGRGRLKLVVADTARITSIKVKATVDHTWVGDLVVRVRPPLVTGVGWIVLQDREGGSARNLRRTYDPVNAPGLAACVGKSPKGTWVLEVADTAKADEGTIRSFSLELGA